MISVNETQDHATKFSVSMGIASLVAISILALGSLAIRDTPDMPEIKPAIEKSSNGIVGNSSVQVIPPIQQERFYR